MFKKIICIVLLICICSSLFAVSVKNAEPYSEDEFPKFALDLRRAEILFAGSLPIVYPLTNLVFKTLDKETDFWKTFGISCSVSAAIVVIDYVIGIFSE